LIWRIDALAGDPSAGRGQNGQKELRSRQGLPFSFMGVPARFDGFFCRFAGYFLQLKGKTGNFTL
jgi:hypothetical protein